MPDHLLRLSELAKKRVNDGYYDQNPDVGRVHASLVRAIRASEKTPIIAEIKFASPSSGKIREIEPPLGIARALLSGGAAALSILTDPDGFQGELEFLAKIAKEVRAPLIMKDIIVSPRQLRAAANFGADAVVLISELYKRGLASSMIKPMIDEARKLGLEVLLEANETRAFQEMQTIKPDLYGINNRNLSTLDIDIGTTERILSQTKPEDGPVVSESGIESADDVRRLKTAGADAFLIGTSIMRSRDVEQKVRDYVNA